VLCGAEFLKPSAITDKSGKPLVLDIITWDRKTAAYRTLPVAVLALLPSHESRPYVRAKRIFRGLNAEMVSELSMVNWVKKTMKVLPATPWKLGSG
jgi:hypothetical protein